MNKRFSILCLLYLSLGQLAWAQEPLTLEKIMSHPRWIGTWPEEVKYGPDGNSIYYLSHKDPRGYEVVEIDESGEVIKIHDTSGMPRSGSRSAGKTLFAFKGDLFLSNPLTTRLTRTQKTESDCRWLDAESFVYRSGGVTYVQDLSTRTRRQVAELRFKDEPKSGDDFRSEQQDRLFPVLKAREQAKEKRSREKGIPRFYLGKGRQLEALEVAPGERQALLVHSAEDSQKRDKMPVYLNRDGQVGSQKLRAKVGARDNLDHQLEILDLRRASRRKLDLSALPAFTSKTSLFVEDSKWSKDGRLALSLFSEDYEERWIVEVDFAKAALKLVEHLHDDAWHSWDLNEFGWTSGGTLWYQSEKSGYAHLYLWEEGSSRALTSGRFEVTSIHPSPDGRHFFFRANKEDSGRYDVYRVDLSGGIEKITDMGGQTTYDLSPDGKKLVLLNSHTASPPEIYLQAAKAGAQPRKLTNLVSREFRRESWVLPKFVDIPSTHHSRPIRSKLYEVPKGIKKVPAAVVFVHGAGYLQNADQGWSYYFREFMFHTLLAHRGVTVLDMDYRASAGYGRDWRTAIYRQMGTPELEDLKDGVAYLVRTHGIDPKRVGVYGGSYGGFMTLMALFKEPELFACGAALRPVTDWAQYEHEYTARILNTPDEDPEAYLRSSPIEFAEGLSKPLLMCHGMLDDNVVAQDTVRLTQRLIQLKKKNWEMALYPVEPHGFVEPESWLDEYRRILKLFEENLGI